MNGAVHRLAGEPRAEIWLLAALALAVLCGLLVAAAGWIGGALLRQLRYRSFHAPARGGRGAAARGERRHRGRGPGPGSEPRARSAP